MIGGGKRLKGEIKVFGAKNAAMKMMAASILFEEPVILDNVPEILDITKLSAILTKMGAKIERKGHQLSIDTSKLANIDPDPFLVGTFRASVVLIGPLLARFGQVRIAHPGGDKIGRRPIDRHLKAFGDLGIKVAETNDSYLFQKTDYLNTKVHFEKISVTATENILIFACGQQETISIDNAAIEPEVIDLCNFLQKGGAKISISGRQISVSGGKLKKVRHQVIPDRIEAGTFAVLAAATASSLKITDLIPEHLGAFLNKLREIGVQFEIGDNFLYIRKPLENKISTYLRASKISTAEYPGLPTDLQPPLGLLLTQAVGESLIQENIFENRLGYLKELQKMGAKIKVINNHLAKITGPAKLHGADISSLDIRTGATLIIAGLIASDKTQIAHAENIDRGYERIEERLQKLGADIKRIS